jgi:hypothetical protein
MNILITHNMEQAPPVYAPQIQLKRAGMYIVQIDHYRNATNSSRKRRPKPAYCSSYKTARTTLWYHSILNKNRRCPKSQQVQSVECRT